LTSAASRRSRTAPSRRQPHPRQGRQEQGRPAVQAGRVRHPVRQGISREGGLIDIGVEAGLVRKSGAWYTYEGDQLGQGKENARAFLRDNPDLTDELEKRLKDKLGIGARLDLPADEELVDLTGAVPEPGPLDL
jgi:hypothetical protein